MKTSLTKSRNSVLFLALFAAFPLWARPIAQVTEVMGQVFVITPDGKTVTVKANDHLEEKSEIMVEEGGTVTLNDYFDATYHLIGGSHLKLFNQSVQLKRGKTWIQAHNPSHHLALTTANGLIDFTKSEFITTFDQANSRSQVLVVHGDVEVSNILDKQAKFPVPSGTFTLVDPEVENGVPRSPTKVGLASLNNALAEFKQLPGVMKDATAPSRKIASVDEAANVSAKKGEIIFISTNRMPASVTGNAHNYYVKNVKKKFKHSADMAPVAIKFYGMTPFAAPKAQTPRSPASVPVQVKMPQKAVEKVNLDHEFSETLKRQMDEQPKHSKELESLIQDLKSY